MNRKVIKLTESDLHRIIKESVVSILEGFQRERGYFNVMDMFPTPANIPSDFDVENSEFDRRGISDHFIDDRTDRIENIVAANDYDIGTPMYSFVVDTGHPRGPEVHTITAKAIVVIQNYNDGRYATLWALTPKKLNRYFEGLIAKGKLSEMPNDSKYRVTLSGAVRNIRLGIDRY